MKLHLKSTLLVLVFGFVACSNTWAQSRESWVPEPWPDPTDAPQLGSNRMLLYRSDSARTALLALATHLTQQGFVLQEVTPRHVQTQRRQLPDSLRFNGGAGMDLLVTTIQAFPAILLVRGTGTPNLRRLNRLSGVSRAHPNGHGHKIRYPGVVGENDGVPASLSQVVFDRMVTLLRSSPIDRMRYLTL